MCGGYDAGFKRFAGGLMGRGLGLMLGFEYVVPEEDRRSLRIRIEFRKVSLVMKGRHGPRSDRVAETPMC